MEQQILSARRFGALALLLILLLSTPAAEAQTQLTGRVRGDDGRPIASALAEVHPASDSTQVEYTLTSELGFFAFRDLAPGAYVLTVTRLGFRDYREQIDVETGAALFEVTMERRPIALQGVTVEAERSRARTRFEESAGITVQEIGSAALKSIPVIAESDPLRAIEVLPGVTSVSDFSASFNV
ncbi:MAG: carboxypeptidase regulatory-like domain-containing protein, partial [Gemmatimonadetes bacterium]|nr:carboxypeptidase regulatory-like domain-containing protein [Gemmatimonadota bacterium]